MIAKNNKLTQIKYENKPLKYSHILYENNMDSFLFFAVQGEKVRRIITAVRQRKCGKL